MKFYPKPDMKVMDNAFLFQIVLVSLTSDTRSRRYDQITAAMSVSSTIQTAVLIFMFSLDSGFICQHHNYKLVYNGLTFLTVLVSLSSAE